MKVCFKCGIEKKIDDFHRCKKSKDGRVARCKECVNKYYLKNKKKFDEKAKKRYHERKTDESFMQKRRDDGKEYRKRNPKNWKKIRKKRRLEMIKIKGDKCEICGFDDKRILEFHHKNGRPKTEWKREIFNKSYDMSLLQLLCPNCHSLIHYTEKEQEKKLCVS